MIKCPSVSTLIATLGLCGTCPRQRVAQWWFSFVFPWLNPLLPLPLRQEAQLQLLVSLTHHFEYQNHSLLGSALFHITGGSFEWWLQKVCKNKLLIDFGQNFIRLRRIVLAVRGFIRGFNFVPLDGTVIGWYDHMLLCQQNGVWNGSDFKFLLYVRLHRRDL